MSAGYTERLWPPLALWLVVAFFVLTLVLAVYVPLGPVAGLLTVLVAGGGTAAGLVVSAARIRVSGGHLRAGRATIPVAALGAVTPLGAEEARRLRGRDIDPRAYHCLRGWVGTAVRADVVDPADPTPYWYVSTRRPLQLAAALEQARSGPGG